MFTYLLLNLLIVAFPLALSFDKKVAFYSRWKIIWQGILLNMLVFIPWDAAFASLGVWEFNPDYHLRVKLLHLPIEEWLFFITAPYAALFIYECLIIYFPNDVLFRWRKGIAWAVILISLFVYFNFSDHLYTAVNALYLSFAMLILLVSGRSAFLGRFFMTYIIILLPFLIFNGALTAIPVVKYNDAENMGIRLFTIPLDDVLYNMGMLLIPLANYARLRAKRMLPEKSD